VIKVFIRDIDRADYVSIPADGFRLQGTYFAARSSGREGDDGPQTDEMSFVFQLPLNSQPTDVYQAIYDQVLSDCSANGWDTPAKTDIYGWIPLDFSMLIP
jgi:hypothetical protein